jgi:histidine ammonia-lyase
MGCNAAVMTKKVIDNTFEVLSIQMVTVLQAIDYASYASKLSPVTHRVYASVRALFPKFVEDKPRYRELEHVKKYFLENDPEMLYAHNVEKVVAQ